MSRNVDDQILERLDNILRVLALQAIGDRSISEGVQLLKTAGLDNKTIAQLLDTTPATVRTLTSNFRKKSRLISRG